MNTYADNNKGDKKKQTHSIQKKENGAVALPVSDVNPTAATQLQEIADNSPQVQQAIQLQAMANTNIAVSLQKKANNTGLPDTLKSGIENLSGHSLDDVKTHYNSDKPAELQAHAYVQGTDIHIASGQEKHLPHEAWHVVQQKQGTVKPTLQMKGDINVNDDDHLEMEADVMGSKALGWTESDATSTGTPLQKKSIEPSGNLVQLKLNKQEVQIIIRYIEDTLRGIMTIIPNVISPDLIGQIQNQVMLIQRNAINNYDDLYNAALYIDQQLTFGALQVMSRLAPNLARIMPPVRYQNDPAFEKFRRDVLASPMDHMQSAGILHQAMMDSTPSPHFKSGGNQVREWMNNPTVSLRLFTKVHESIQKILFIVNARLSKQEQMQITNGEELLHSVGRLSMMIADVDFLPFWDSRPLPMNWTTDYFLEERSKSHKGGAYTPEQLEILKDKLHKLRQQIKPEASDPTNTKKDFRYEGRIPTGSDHALSVHSEGALRLDFQDGRRILDEVNPNAENEDLSYENIVKYLTKSDGAMLRSQIRRGFADMSEASPFIRELMILLVGIEGTQNNMMALHAPMITDLIAQGNITWGQGLFTGQRTQSIEHMPMFVYASDATQKGTNSSKNKGPMVRQSELMRTGVNERELKLAKGARQIQGLNSQDNQALASLTSAAEALFQQKNSTKLEQDIQALRDKTEKEIQDWARNQKKWLEEQQNMTSEDAAQQIEKTLPTYAEKQRAKLEQKINLIKAEFEKNKKKLVSNVQKQYNKDESHLGFQQQIKAVDMLDAQKEEREKSEGYDVFLDVYMKQQFNLMNMFINAFFPHVHSLDFGEGEEGQTNYVNFAQRLIEYYMLHRFYGEGEKGKRAMDRYSSNRKIVERFMSLRSGTSEKEVQTHNSTPALNLQWYLAQMIDSQFMTNNCLIYAIAGAAGMQPTRQDIYTLRLQLRKMAGEDLGNMLDFNIRTVGIIMNHFGLSGTVNLYTGNAEAATDTLENGNGGIYNIYYANRHFTPHQDS